MSDKPGVSSVSSVGFRLSRSGRFSGETDPLMEQFNASIGYDKRMWRQDGEGSLPVIPCKQSLPGRIPSRLHTSGGSGLRLAPSNRRGAPPLPRVCVRVRVLMWTWKRLYCTMEIIVLRQNTISDGAS
jgi:hypothetical protein